MKKILRYIVPVLVCIVLLVSMAVPSMAAEVNSPLNMDMQYWMTSADFTDTGVRVHFDFDRSNIYYYAQYYDPTDGQTFTYYGLEQTFQLGEFPAVSGARLIWQVVPQPYLDNNGMALTPVSGVEDGMTLYIDMKVGADVPLNVNYTKFVIEYYDIDENFLSTDYGTYDRDTVDGYKHYYGTYTYEIPDSAYSYRFYFSYDRSGTSIQEVIDADISISEFYIDMTNSQYVAYYDTGDSDDVMNGDADMNQEANDMNDAVNDSADKVGDAMEDLNSVEKPDISDLLAQAGFTDGTYKDLIYSMIQDVWSLTFIKELLMTVVVMMLLSYVLFGKKQ